MELFRQRIEGETDILALQKEKDRINTIFSNGTMKLSTCLDYTDIINKRIITLLSEKCKK